MFGMMLSASAAGLGLTVTWLQTRTMQRQLTNQVFMLLNVQMLTMWCMLTVMLVTTVCCTQLYGQCFAQTQEADDSPVALVYIHNHVLRMDT